MNKPIPPVLAIVGSRNWPDHDAVINYVWALSVETVVVSGGSGRVDLLAVTAAQDYERCTVEFVPIKHKSGWEVQCGIRPPGKKTSIHKFPKIYPHFAAAAHARNSMIVNYCVEHGGGLTAFLDETVKSNGTRSTIEKAEKAGVLYEVITYKGAEG